MMVTTLTYAGKGAVLMAGLFLVGFGIKTIEPLPPETPVVFDIISGRYATVRCVVDGDLERPFTDNPFDALDDEYRATLGQVRRYGRERAHPDAVCVDRDGFSGRIGSISGDIVRELKRLLAG